ncbi:hypothetical protein EMPS_01349 [Entomortierella parvispora]|uniref:Uncharacterized protein n=1 Tax=Entomortierella parvispora TaxID=205924 RepID=A0A9P3H2Q2_9FUNG|nr:hypothetical protein EMPS_01349 [Entomortierella parvispora]
MTSSTFASIAVTAPSAPRIRTSPFERRISQTTTILPSARHLSMAIPSQRWSSHEPQEQITCSRSNPKEEQDIDTDDDLDEYNADDNAYENESVNDNSGEPKEDGADSEEGYANGAKSRINFRAKCLRLMSSPRRTRAFSSGSSPPEQPRSVVFSLSASSRKVFVQDQPHPTIASQESADQHKPTRTTRADSTSRLDAERMCADEAQGSGGGNNQDTNRSSAAQEEGTDAVQAFSETAKAIQCEYDNQLNSVTYDICVDLYRACRAHEQRLSLVQHEFVRHLSHPDVPPLQGSLLLDGMESEFLMDRDMVQKFQRSLGELVGREFSYAMLTREDMAQYTGNPRVLHGYISPSLQQLRSPHVKVGTHESSESGEESDTLPEKGPSAAALRRLARREQETMDPTWAAFGWKYNQVPFKTLQHLLTTAHQEMEHHDIQVREIMGQDHSIRSRLPSPSTVRDRTTRLSDNGSNSTGKYVSTDGCHRSIVFKGSVSPQTTTAPGNLRLLPSAVKHPDQSISSLHGNRGSGASSPEHEGKVPLILQQHRATLPKQLTEAVLSSWPQQQQHGHRDNRGRSSHPRDSLDLGKRTLDKGKEKAHGETPSPNTASPTTADVPPPLHGSSPNGSSSTVIVPNSNVGFQRQRTLCPDPESFTPTKTCVPTTESVGGPNLHENKVHPKQIKDRKKHRTRRRSNGSIVITNRFKGGVHHHHYHGSSSGSEYDAESSTATFRRSDFRAESSKSHQARVQCAVNFDHIHDLGNSDATLLYRYPRC